MSQKKEKIEKDAKQRSSSTLAALLKEKPKRGRPSHNVSRQNVYVALAKSQKKRMRQLANLLSDEIGRADIPDLSITVLTARLEALRRAVADRNREMPEGITDLESLYLLWDLPLPTADEKEPSWTSIRVSPQQVIELGRAHGTLNAVFGANRSETFSLAMSLLEQLIEDHPLIKQHDLLDEMRKEILEIYA
ncbi:MAG: hypothetical protein H6654_06335 [Ardenticatenaceae bacterium]|nr:hypothetical protein [Anaerolineales bacterium]MCB8942084.1 hypothetical protein [Ardenticatenaceae bacterium]MCB8973156.1 hypothetical protein [Ardenticatenaceae bacterium]